MYSFISKGHSILLDFTSHSWLTIIIIIYDREIGSILDQCKMRSSYNAVISCMVFNEPWPWPWIDWFHHITAGSVCYTLLIYTRCAVRRSLSTCLFSHLKCFLHNISHNTANFINHEWYSQFSYWISGNIFLL